MEKKFNKKRSLFVFDRQTEVENDHKYTNKQTHSFARADDSDTYIYTFKSQQTDNRQTDSKRERHKRTASQFRTLFEFVVYIRNARVCDQHTNNNNQNNKAVQIHNAHFDVNVFVPFHSHKWHRLHRFRSCLCCCLFVRRA